MTKFDSLMCSAAERQDKDYKQQSKTWKVGTKAGYMPASFYEIAVHIIFGTKYRNSFQNDGANDEV
jgi:hypothetical protein